MKYGAKNAEDTRIRFDQTNNIIEHVLADLKAAGEIKFWLESCNVEASACAVEAIGAKWKHEIPKTSDGSAMFGQGDLLFFLLFSSFGQRRAPIIRKGVMENEISANLSWAIKENSNAKSNLVTSGPSRICEDLRASLRRGAACVISYLTDYRSGHYITVVQYDEEKKVFRCYDSWSDNKHCARGGILEEYDDEFFKVRARETFIEVSL